MKKLFVILLLIGVLAGCVHNTVHITSPNGSVTDFTVTCSGASPYEAKIYIGGEIGMTIECGSILGEIDQELLLKALELYLLKGVQ